MDSFGLGIENYIACIYLWQTTCLPSDISLLMPFSHTDRPHIPYVRASLYDSNSMHCYKKSRLASHINNPLFRIQYRYIPQKETRGFFQLLSLHSTTLPSKLLYTPPPPLHAFPFK